MSPAADRDRPERSRDIAHLSSIELLTPCLDETAAFFVDCLGMSVNGTTDGAVYVRTWDDYEQFTVKVVASPSSGVGTTYLRAASADALERRVAKLEALGTVGKWGDGDLGKGPTFYFEDPDGHQIGLYWESEWYIAPPELRPSLKNQASRFPGRGANVRRLDHINYLAREVMECSQFIGAGLGGRLTEQIVLDETHSSGIWYTFSDKTYDMVVTADWAGAHGRLHHIAFATDTREDIFRAADVCLENGIHIETGPHKHAIQQTFFLYVWEPGGNRIELCNAGARLLLAPDWGPIDWTAEDRARGQAWGLKTIETFHTHGTPPVEAVAEHH